MSLYFSTGSPTTELTPADVQAALNIALEKLGPRKKVLAVPPDFTRFHSKAGDLTQYVWNYYGDALTDVLPALGTHKAMTDHEIQTMFGPTPRDLFRVHDWRNDIVTLGEVPGSFMFEVSEGTLDYTFVRPGSLTDAPAGGVLRTVEGYVFDDGPGEISRADLASVLVKLAKDQTGEAFGRGLAVTTKLAVA